MTLNKVLKTFVATAGTFLVALMLSQAASAEGRGGGGGGARMEGGGGFRGESPMIRGGGLGIRGDEGGFGVRGDTDRFGVRGNEDRFRFGDRDGQLLVPRRDWDDSWWWGTPGAGIGVWPDVGDRWWTRPGVDRDDWRFKSPRGEESRGEHHERSR